MKLEFSEQDNKKVLLGLFLGVLIFNISIIFMVWIGINTLLSNQETDDLLNESLQANRIVATLLLFTAIIIGFLIFTAILIITQIYYLLFPQQKQDSVK